MRRVRAGFLGAALACLSLVSATAAAAPTPKEKAESRALAAEAKSAVKQSRFEDAVTALRRADELDPSPQLELDLARALVGAGKLVEASTILHALADAPAKSFSAKKLQSTAKKEVGELESRIPWIQITVTGPKAAEVSTTIDGQQVDATTEVPIDPGEHEIGAEAEGFEGAKKKVTLAEGAHETVRITLKRDAPAAPPPVVEASEGSKIPAAIAFGAGAIGIGVGTVFGLLAFDATSTAKASCKDNVCPDEPEVVDARDAALRNGNISTVGFIVGGVGIAAGVVLLLVTSGPSEPPPAGEAAVIRPWIGVGQAGVAGSF